MNEDLDLATLDRGDEHDVNPDDPDNELAEAEAKAKDKAKEPEPEADDAPEDKPHKDPRIPLARHKEILEKERAQRAALEQKLAQFQKGEQVANLNEDITKLEDSIIKMEKEYTKLLADGELDKAAELMGKIRGAERQISDQKAEMKTTAAVAQATERARYDVVLERIEEAYPELNPESDEYDEKLMARVVKLHRSNLADGMPPAASLQDAVAFVLGKPENKAQRQAVEVTPRVSEKEIAAERKKDAVAKTLDATKRTPPSTAKVGMDSDKLGGGLTAKDITKMSQEDFAKLPDDVLARLRGDDL